MVRVLRLLEILLEILLLLLEIPFQPIAQLADQAGIGTWLFGGAKNGAGGPSGDGHGGTPGRKAINLLPEVPESPLNRRLTAREERDCMVIRECFNGVSEWFCRGVDPVLATVLETVYSGGGQYHPLPRRAG